MVVSINKITMKAHTHTKINDSYLLLIFIDVWMYGCFSFKQKLYLGLDETSGTRLWSGITDRLPFSLILSSHRSIFDF